jgi:RNA polymerase sigma-32 factor
VSTVLSSQPVNGFDAFLQAIQHQPRLSAEEERAAAEDLHATGNPAAARRLVLGHLRFVVHIARGYQGYGLPLEDLVQEGNLGLMKAVQRYQPRWNVRLISYAVHWIKAQIHEYILRNFRIVRHVTTKAQRKLFFNLRKLRRDCEPLSAEDAQAMATQLQVSLRDVRRADALFHGGDSSLSAPDDGYSPEHWLAQEGADPAERIEAEDWQQRMQPKLRRALKTLDPRSRDIVFRRELSAGKPTGLAELGSQYGVSAERVRQIEVKARQRLRQVMEPALAA